MKHTQKYANISNVACDRFSIELHGVRDEASFSPGQDVISWRQSTTTSEMLREKVVGRRFAQAYNGILAGDCAAFDTVETENHVELKTEAEER